MKKKQTKPEATVENVLDESIEALRFGVEAIRAEMEKINAGKAGKSKHDKASRIAFLSQRVGAIADSVRKIEAARAKRTNTITVALVLEWFRSLSDGEQERLLRELPNQRRKGSGLA